MTERTDQVLYLIHYSSDIGLKGKNRPDFIRQLKQNLRRQLPLRDIRMLQSRLLARGPRPDLDLSRVFGVAWWAVPRVVMPPTWENLVAQGVDLVQRTLRQRPVRTFAVRARRSDKRYPKTSLAIENWARLWSRQPGSRST